MKKKTSCTNALLGDIEVIPALLPSPAELAFCKEGIEVALALRKKSAPWQVAPNGRPAGGLRHGDGVPPFFHREEWP